MTDQNSPGFDFQGDSDWRPLDEYAAAEMLDVSVYWLRKARRTKSGPKFVRVGRNVRYLLGDLKNYLAEHRI